jgi:hypothetical protein
MTAVKFDPSKRRMIDAEVFELIRSDIEKS